jgi:hypothetical protein
MHRRPLRVYRGADLREAAAPYEVWKGVTEMVTFQRLPENSLLYPAFKGDQVKVKE